MSKLVIMESPHKASTVRSWLGSGYRVVATVGHVRDLPVSSFGVDIDNDFAAHYINIRGKSKIIQEIKTLAAKADTVLFATDPDREGEAISWHLSQAIGIPSDRVLRVTFNEITKSVVKKSISQPRPLDMNLVNAQQARRILDRIVGYKLSPFLWKTVKSRLSAGRVQSVATKIIVDREKEIRAFIPEEYWTVDAVLSTPSGQSIVVRFYGDENGKITLHNREEAERILNDCQDALFTVKSVNTAIKKKNPLPPFTTSSMQQEASRKLGFTSQRTMKLAQELYEGINVGAENGGTQGLITYMRTDSLRISDEAQNAARAYITDHYGKEYCPGIPKQYKTKSGAQDAHEAIRPSRVDLDPNLIKASLTADQYRLYRLIWERFVASQMESADVKTLTMEFSASSHIFKSSGSTVIFPGYQIVYDDNHVKDETGLAKTAGEMSEPVEQTNLNIKTPEIGESFPASDMTSDGHMTEPRPHYTEASLIKYLEEKGIGRPSTFASIISTIIDREYVKRDGKSLVPTELGEQTCELELEFFSSVVDEPFTATMEKQLDEIENGRATMSEVLTDFWTLFEKQLDYANKNVSSISVKKSAVVTDIICEKCGSQMVIKEGKFGKFIACPNFPRCRNTKPLTAQSGTSPDGSKPATDAKAEAAAPAPEVIPAEVPKPSTSDANSPKCPKCGADLVERSGPYGLFYACSRHPACDYTKQKNTQIGVDCPECGHPLVIKYAKGKAFYGCDNYPACQFSSWDKPSSEKCPQCGKPLFIRKTKSSLFCRTPGCGFEKENS